MLKGINNMAQPCSKPNPPAPAPDAGNFHLAQMLATAQLMAICAAMGMPFVQEEL